MRNNHFSKNKFHQFGYLAEWLAVMFLVMKGYWILARRYRCKAGEIDIIAKRGKTIIFVEVKARKNSQFLMEALGNYQSLRIQNAADYFISKHPSYQFYHQRFDLMLITHLHRLPQHIPNAW